MSPDTRTQMQTATGDGDRGLTPMKGGCRGRDYMEQLLKGGAEGPLIMRIIIVHVDDTTHLASHVEEGIACVTGHCSDVCNGASRVSQIR